MSNVPSWWKRNGLTPPTLIRELPKYIYKRGSKYVVIKPGKKNTWLGTRPTLQEALALRDANL